MIRLLVLYNEVCIPVRFSPLTCSAFFEEDGPCLLAVEVLAFFSSDETPGLAAADFLGVFSAEVGSDFGVTKSC